MEDIIIRMFENIVDRHGGPMHFRIILQPVMATIYATISGIKDAKTGKPPYFWSLLTEPEHRRDMVKDGWKSVGRVFILAVVMDIIYQLMVLKFLYPGEVAIVAFILAILPYLILRGLVTRVARLFITAAD